MVNDQGNFPEERSCSSTLTAVFSERLSLIRNLINLPVVIKYLEKRMLKLYGYIIIL